MDYAGRIRRARLLLSESRLDALVVTRLANIRYLCGFTGSSAALVVSQRNSVLLTDGRYTEQARAEVKGARTRIVKKPAIAAAAEWFRNQPSLRRIGFEAAHLTVTERNMLAKSMSRRATLVEAPAMIERLRMVKDAEEIARIRAACRTGCVLLDRLLTVIRPGVSESQAAGELEFAARKAGVDQMAFPTIIAGGVRSAQPHGRASQAEIPARGFVVCDFGVILAGYCSDMTRTMHVGRPQTEARAVYHAVREAQQAALDAIRPGVTVGEVDRAARKLLIKSRLGNFFTHSTGHGVGLEIHEAPRLAAGQKQRLHSGMVVTIEPGVYVPGKWGVRIEDTVVVTETGCEILTPRPKDLLTL